MNPHDDMGVLGEYLGQFSAAGDVPTSLSGYGYGQQRHLSALGREATSATMESELVRKENRQKAAADLARGSRYADRSVVGDGKGGPQLLVNGPPREFVNPRAQKKVAWKPQWAPAERVAARDVRMYLNALKAPAGSGVKVDAALRKGWAQYASTFQEQRSLLAASPDSIGFAFLLPGAYSTLKAKGARALGGKTPAPKPAEDDWLIEEERKAGRLPPKPRPAPQPGPAPGSVRVSVGEVQDILVKLGQDPARITDGKFGPTTKAKYQAVAKQHRLNATVSGRTGAKVMTVSEGAYTALKQKAAETDPGRPPPTPQDKRIVVATSEVQGILKRLGAPPERLSDDMTGPTTERYWKESAAGRQLDPFIVKAAPNLKSVRVSEKTFLMLKAAADAKVSPDASQPKVGTDLLSLGPDAVITITAKQLGDTLSNVGVAVQKLIAGGDETAFLNAWTAEATKRGLDGRVQVAGPGKIVVLRATWDALSEIAPPAPKPGPARDQMAENLAIIMKNSTASVSMKMLRRALNVAIQSGTLKREPFNPVGPWKGEMRPIVLNMMGVPHCPQTTVATDKLCMRDVWAAALVKGRLISADGRTVRLPPDQAKSLQAQAARFQAAKKDESERLKNFTEANPGELIAKINSFGVSDKKFDVSGGAQELGDAIKTFFENTGTKAPAGDFIRLGPQGKKVYVRNSILVALKTQAEVVAQRAAATQQARAAIVTNALKESSGTLTVREFQEGVKHTIRSAKAGIGKPLSDKEKKLYRAVKVSGSFDKPTRAAFTEIARTMTIGAAMQNLQDLMKTQLGPAFTKKAVVEVRRQVWSQYLKAAVSNGNIKTLPAIAGPMKKFAELYRQNVDAKKRDEEFIAEQKKVMDAALAKSKYIVAILDVQEALLEMAKPGRTTAQKIVSATGITPTGFANPETRKGLHQLAEFIFPQDYELPETMWMGYLKEVGILVENGRTKKGWRGASYIALPQALADLIAKNAGQWEFAQGGRAGASANVAPLPLTDEKLLLRFRPPVVITATKVEKKVETAPEKQPPATQPATQTQPAQAAAEDAKKKTEDAIVKTKAATQKQADAQQKEVIAQQQPQDERLRQAADQAHREAAISTQEAQSAAGEAQAAQDVATQAGGAQVTGPSITGPTIQITTPAATQQAGMGGGMGMVALGVGALALLLAARPKEDETRRT
jgi:hypothetical protein